ncbi:unnamed protein product [Gongylonema pulchrum]|uniref:Secreted protein n=1 Tax=Gongylonema pulchrum TaxID=637853 RepID=A0A183F145_9BILA|nr:unnamed protein product [Gongylonema pulchrum]
MRTFIQGRFLNIISSSSSNVGWLIAVAAAAGVVEGREVLPCAEDGIDVTTLAFVACSGDTNASSDGFRLSRAPVNTALGIAKYLNFRLTHFSNV